MEYWGRILIMANWDRENGNTIIKVKTGDKVKEVMNAGVNFGTG